MLDRKKNKGKGEGKPEERVTEDGGKDFFTSVPSRKG